MSEKFKPAPSVPFFRSPGPEKLEARKMKLLSEGDNRLRITELLLHPSENHITDDTKVELCLQVTEDKNLFLMVIGTPLAVAARLENQALIPALLSAGLTWRADLLTHLFLVLKQAPDKHSRYLAVANPEYYLLFCSLKENERDLVLEDLLRQSGDARDFGKTLHTTLPMDKHWYEPLSVPVPKDPDLCLLPRLEKTLGDILAKNRRSGAFIPLTLDYLSHVPTKSGLISIECPTFFSETLIENQTDLLFLHYSEAWIRGETKLSETAARSMIRAGSAPLSSGQIRAYLGRKLITFFLNHEVHPSATVLLDRMTELCKGSGLSRVFLVRYLIKHMDFRYLFSPGYPSEIHFLNEPEREALQQVLSKLRMDVHEVIDAVMGSRWEFNEYNGFPGIMETSARCIIHFLYDVYGSPLVLDGSRAPEMELLENLFRTSDLRHAAGVLHGMIDHVEGENDQSSLWQTITSSNNPELVTLAIRKNLIPKKARDSLVRYAIRNSFTTVIPYLYAFI